MNKVNFPCVVSFNEESFNLDVLFIRDGKKEMYIIDGKEMTIETAVIYVRKQGFDLKETYAYLKSLFHDFQNAELAKKTFY